MRRIKGRVRDAAPLREGATVMVSELHCHAPGCPEVETVIAVMGPGGARRQVRFDCGIAELARETVQSRSRR